VERRRRRNKRLETLAMMRVCRLIALSTLVKTASSFSPSRQLLSAPSTALFGYDGNPQPQKRFGENGGLPTFNPPSRDRAQNEYLDQTPKNQFPYVVTGDQSAELSYDPAAFPKNLPLQQIQGGNSRLTYKMPQGADRAQIYIQTNGRPLKARVELWLGPIRRVHFMDISNMNGAETPYRGCVKFKNTDSAGPQTLEISTSEDQAFPCFVGVDVMTPERSKERQQVFDETWKASQKIYSQGDKTIRSIPIADHCKSVQLLVWSKDVGKKSFKANVEFLQGPNCKRQYYQLQCGGSTQPYQAVFETPGNGWTMRWQNTKTLHDGSHEFVIIPHELESDAPPEVVAEFEANSGSVNSGSHLGGSYGSSLGPHGF